ncbi:rod shape-determining protein RodA [Caulobacter sp. S45]|uniref:rod shape-determining protein RodA n=1 Tax=Caulobacter sp. S45 TaxID=1641861 RepID=UPI00131B174C|nr:rod shape-determining protein RodA [Caulobacter sp. S45]
MTSSAITRPGERERLSSKLKQIDWTFTVLLCIIAALGTAMLYSVAPLAWHPWAAKHLMRFCLCLALMLALTLLNLRIWLTLAYPIYGAGFFLLLAVMAVGHTSLGAKRWLQFGPIQIQPSEIMKIGLVLALARFYHGVSAKDARWSWKLLFPAGMIALPMLLIAKQPDLGTALLIGFTGAAMMFLAGLDWRALAAGVVGVVVAVPVFVKFIMKGYQRDRVLTFLSPEDDPSGSGYHILQSKIALGSGGLLGKGYGLGTQSQLNFLPEKHTDFIFATFAEQFGFVGCTVLLLLYGAIIFMALRTAMRSHSHFGRLAAGGVTATFAFYILVNASMVMGMAPVVGVPMPLLSYGGTEVLTVMIGFALVQAVRVHRYAEVTSGKGMLV